MPTPSLFPMFLKASVASIIVNALGVSVQEVNLVKVETEITATSTGGLLAVATQELEVQTQEEVAVDLEGC